MRWSLVLALLVVPAAALAQPYPVIVEPPRGLSAWPDGAEVHAGLRFGPIEGDLIDGVVGGLHLGVGYSASNLRLGVEYDLLGLEGDVAGQPRYGTGRARRLGAVARARKLAGRGLIRLGVQVAAIYLEGGVAHQQLRWDGVARHGQLDGSVGVGLEALLGGGIATGVDVGFRVAFAEDTRLYLLDLTLVVAP